VKTITIRTRIESETLNLPELRELLGKRVEIVVSELALVDRQEVFAEALRQPDTPEEYAAQQATFRVWLRDPCYEHLWPMIERLVDTDSASAGNGAALPQQASVR
jgi:hypothetical protein